MQNSTPEQPKPAPPSRRDLLKLLSTGVLSAAALSAMDPAFLYAQADPSRPQPPTLVVLYLRGGCDPLNTIAPFGDSTYYGTRPTIALPRPGQRNGVIRINNHFGWHPACSEIADLYEQGRVAPILNVGSPHPTRSHFDSQDFMERAAPGIKSVTEGWLNRYLEATKDQNDSHLRAVSLQAVLPRSLRGQYNVLAVPDYGAEEAMAAFHKMYSCDDNAETEAIMQSAEDATRQRITEAGEDGIKRLRELNRIVNSNIHQSRYPDTHLGNQFRDIAKLIKARVSLEVVAIDYNGWDHHAYQGGTQGTQARMLREVSQSVQAFMNDLDERMGQTLVLVMTEFGRTVRENGTNGTDHGRGGFMLAIGGTDEQPLVNGGNLYGKWTGLDRRALIDGRDLPVHVDFRQVFAEALLKLFKFDSDGNGFFPEFELKPQMLNYLTT